jgi:nucleoside-diphosphate-sugar epimerase
LVVATVQDQYDLRDLVAEARPDALIHAAWPVPPGSYLDSPENAAGLRWSEAVWAASARVPRVVGLGSCLELGSTSRIRAEYDVPEPDTAYAKAKDDAHRAGVAALGGRLTWARLFHVYGPGEGPGRLLRDALENFRQGREVHIRHGRDLRDWMYAADAADAVLTLVEQDVGGVVHVCGGALRTTGDHLRALARRAGAMDLLRVDPELGPRPAVFGLGTVLQDLGWTPRFRHADGIAAVVEGFVHRADSPGVVRRTTSPAAEWRSMAA